MTSTLNGPDNPARTIYPDGVAAVLTTMRLALDSRASWALRAHTSMVRQTHRTSVHIVDTIYDGYISSRLAMARNERLWSTTMGWIAYLDDDNWWDPWHIEALWNNRRANAEVEYDVICAKRHPWQDPSGSCSVDYGAIAHDPSGCLIRVEFLRSLGGWCETFLETPSDPRGWTTPLGFSSEDGHFWHQCGEVGARIVDLDHCQPSWHYEMGPRLPGEPRPDAQLRDYGPPGSWASDYPWPQNPGEQVRL